VTVDVNDVFRRGGKELIDLLSFCVFSVRFDALFAFLAGEFRALPTPEKGVALFDVFCAHAAPARISAAGVLPPIDSRLKHAVDPFRPSVGRAPVPRYLFDHVTDSLEQASPNWRAKLSEAYDPTVSPMENLPGGKMTQGQQAFVDNVWRPGLRPHLVAAGFRRIANVG